LRSLISLTLAQAEIKMLTILLLMTSADPNINSELEAKFELLKIKQNYNKLYAKCNTQDQKIVVFVDYENLSIYARLLKEYPTNTLYCYAKTWEGIDKGIVVGRYNNKTLERFQDIKIDQTDQLFKARIKVLENKNKVDRIKYPVREHFWTGCSDWTHLTNGVHAGKFDSTWLKLLSWQELQSLHSDDHEGKVQWKFVVPSPR
jgi:hypothetical protein